VIRGVLIAVLLLAAAPVHAEDVIAYEAEGEAAAAGSDPRVSALDDAFARAVTSALADLVQGDARVAHKGELDREIVGHARLWVKSYAVTRDEVNDDRRQLVVTVRIDRDKLRTRLGELGVPAVAVTAAPEPPPQARSVVILLRVATPHGGQADFGDNGSKDTPGVAALTSALRAAGFAVRRARTPEIVRSDSDFPVSDDEADALVADAKADLALVAAVSVGVAVPARGQPKDVALVTARVRLLDHKKVIGQGSAIAAALGDEGSGYAIDHALTSALGDVVPPVARKMPQAGGYHGEDVPLAEPGVVLVRVPAKTPWRLVLEEEKYLSGAKGVRAATLRRLSPRGWVIGVATAEPVERIAQIVKHAPTADSSAEVRIVGEIVDVSLTGAAP
jgi:hypothetical protein